MKLKDFVLGCRKRVLGCWKDLSLLSPATRFLSPKLIIKRGTEKTNPFAALLFQ